MTLVLKNVQLCADGRRSRMDALLEDGRLVAMEPGIPVPSRAVVLEKPNIVLFPGLIDVHVHLREPGFSYFRTAEQNRLGFVQVANQKTENRPSPIP